MVHSRKLIAEKISRNFREATKIIDVALPAPSEKEVLIQNFYVGINASDVNFTAGTYNRMMNFFVHCVDMFQA